MLIRLVFGTALFLAVNSIGTCDAPAGTHPPSLPSEDVMRQELSTLYKTKAPRPRLQHKSHLAARIEPLFFQQARYLLGTLRPWEDGATTGAMFLTDGSSGEHGIRPNAHTAYGLAILARFVLQPSSSDRAEAFSGLRDRCGEAALALLRFLLPTHGAGGVPCTDGKLWRSQWQSALWANETGKAAWLLWDKLTVQEQWLAARMIQDEANRFVDADPPVGVVIDTKSEENSWNSSVLSLASNMFPDHPDASRWRAAAIRWILNSYGRERDLESSAIYDGRKLSEWLVGAVLHDDYTLENHNRVHPDYMGVTRATLLQTLVYDWGETTVPEALKFNVREVQNIIEELAWPDGGVLYPNGQDWQIHRGVFYLAVHAIHAIFFSDERSAALMRMSLESCEAMAARDGTGGIYLPEEYFFPSTQHYILKMFGETWLLLRQYGEGPSGPSLESLFESLAGLYVYPSGKFAVYRTGQSAASFSWGNQVMGQVLPLAKDLVVTPNERGLIGIVREPGKKEIPPKVLQTSIAPSTETLQVAGVLERAGGKVEQRYAFVVLPDGRTIYADVLISRTSSPLELHLGTVGVLNEPRWVYHDGDRTIHASNGSHTFRADAPDTTNPLLLHSPWINIDDRLGVVCLAGSGQQAYIPRTVWKTGRIEQLLHLNYLPKAQGKPGTPLAGSVLLFYPLQQADQTARMAGRSRLSSAADGITSILLLEDGTRVAWDLQKLETQVKPQAN